jgi:hypothetical protein
MRAAHKAPRNILIGHAYYTVKYDKHLSENSEAIGLTGPETQRILLDPQVGADVERETLLHELIHAICFQAGLRLEGEPFQKTKVEEKVVWTVAPKILELLRDNPELVEFLLESGG